MQWFRCSKCNNVKPSSSFYKNSAGPTGFRPSCKTCDLAAMDKNNRKKYELEYRKKNPEKRRKILSKWYEKNKERYAAVQSKYRRTDAFKANHRKHSANRRAREKESFVEVVDFFKLYTGFCFYCGEEISFSQAEFDHYIPISKGGKHKKDNIVCSCMRCNRKKGASIPKGVRYQMV